MHYQEIAERVEQRGYEIRGRNKAGNALAHMSHSPQFRSLGKGQWTWTDSAGESPSLDDTIGATADPPVRWIPGGWSRVPATRAPREWVGRRHAKGISYPAEGDHVLLFSDPGEANAFGYNDGWEAPGVYRYFGEWRGPGDMAMSGGNAAIRERSPNLHLLIRTNGGYRYEGSFAYREHHTQPADREGVTSQAMYFGLWRSAGWGFWLIAQRARRTDPHATLATVDRCVTHHS